MPNSVITYDVTFRDFSFLQTYMTRRVLAKNKRNYVLALAGVVLCAVLLTMAIVVNASRYRAHALFANSVPYPTSIYLLIILFLVTAILSLIPAIKLRLKTLRMQVSDNGPFLGVTKLIVEPDGLTVDRSVMRAKYLWAAFQGVEISKNAVILPLDNGIGLIVPATAFSSDSERYEFAAVISKHMQAMK